MNDLVRNITTGTTERMTTSITTIEIIIRRPAVPDVSVAHAT